MSIKIDLLPGYVPLRRTFRRVLGGLGLLFLIVAASIGLIYMADERRLEKLRADVEAIEPFATKATETQAEADRIIAETVPVKSVVDFMADASKTGPERAAALDLMRRYVYAGAVVSEIDMSTGTAATIRATVRTPDEYARMLYALRNGSAEENGPLFTGLPVGTGVPGFPEGRLIERPQGPIYTPTAIEFPLAVTLQGNLKNDAAGRPLLYVPAEPPGTAVATVGNAAGVPGGAGGGAPAPPPPPAPPPTNAAPTAP